MDNEDYNTKLQIFETSWKNTGIYTLKAENDSGVDEATVEVTVLGMCLFISFMYFGIQKRSYSIPLFFYVFYSIAAKPKETSCF